MVHSLIDLSVITADPSDNITLFDPHTFSDYFQSDQTRYQHIIGVVEEMTHLCHQLDVTKPLRDQLISIAYLHDIGYSERLQQTNFHPVDGAIFAQEQGFAKPIVAAVLFHSEAHRTWTLSSDIVHLYELNHSYLDKTDQLLIDLITYCDLHRGPDGQRVTLEERIRDIIKRYGLDNPVSQQMLHNMKYYLITCEQVEKYLQQGLPDLTV